MVVSPFWLVHGPGTTLVVCCVLVPCFVFYKLYLEGIVPDNVPWAGTNEAGRIAQLKSTILAIFRLRPLLAQEYRKDRLCLVGIVHNGPIVVLPRSDIPWYRTQEAKGTISFEALQQEKLHVKYATVDPEIKDPLYMTLLRRTLAQSYTACLQDVADEIRRDLNHRLGAEHSTWHRVSCFNLVERAVAVGTMTMAIGADSEVQDAGLLDAAQMMGKSLFLNAFVIQSMPAWLSPTVGRICQTWPRRHWRQLMHTATPIIDSMLTTADSLESDSPPQTTLLYSYIQESKRTANGQRLLTMHYLQNLLVMVSLAAVGGTMIACGEALLNILSYPGCQTLVEELRAEAQQLLSGPITKDALNAMVITDNVCKETLRLENGDHLGAEGVATVPLATKDGNLLPKGTRIALPMYGLHRDSELYPGNPTTFDPYRFCKSVDGKQSRAHDASDQYVPFATGTHACPGRFFAVALTKIIIAILVYEYDMAPLDRRPWGPRIGSYTIPPAGAKIQVRKRRSGLK